MVRFNENNEVIRNEEYTAILAGIQLREDISYSMEELAGLAEADGVAVAGQMILGYVQYGSLWSGPTPLR